MSTVDLVVIGGGITGAGVLKEAAEQGLSTLLVEADHLGGKTTMISSGLIHGGLRYLPYDAVSTRVCCSEAGIIHDLAPHLLKRQVFLWPVYKGRRLSLDLVEALMEGYDELAPLKLGLPHVRLNREETLLAEPQISPHSLEGSISFDEWSVDPQALVNWNLAQAQIRGAQIKSHAKVVGFVLADRRVCAVKIKNTLTSQEETIEAKFIVNAAGPWADQVARLSGAQSVHFRLRKGVHLIVKNPGLKTALLFPEPTGRYIGAYPRGEEIWIGPTDDPFDGNLDNLSVNEEEISKLKKATVKVLPHIDSSGSRTAVGVRPIIFQRGFGFLLTRDYKIYDHENLDGVSGLVTVTGGKMTIFRKMAKETMDLVARKISSGIPRGRQEKKHNRFVVLLSSLLALIYYFLRHSWRRACGTRREGLELFRSTYKVGEFEKVENRSKIGL